jgi:hypothetical protein
MKRVRINGLFLTAISAATLCWLLIVSPVHAQGLTIQVDERGNGFTNGLPIQFALQPDPGPGGATNALTYFPLPFAGVVGDVLLSDPEQLTSDLIRFNGNGTLVFYSNNLPDGAEPGDIADVGVGVVQSNLVQIAEIGPEGNNGATYTPGPGQPGYDPINLPTYVFISDIPEPTTVILVGLGLAGLLAFCHRRK